MSNTTHDAGPLFIDLQWFAEDADNPGGGSGEGADADGSFATNLVEDQAAPKGDKPAEPNPQQGGQKPTELPGWTNATTKELRADPRFTPYASKFKSFDDAVKSAMELETKLGGMVTIPTDKSTPEEVAEFYAKIGGDLKDRLRDSDIPKKPEEYEFEKSKDLEYSDEDLDAFREVALKLKLTKDQAKEMFAMANEQASRALTAYAERQAEQKKAAFQDCEATLKKEWGQEFQTKIGVAKRGLSAYGDSELIADAKRTGMGNSPSFMKLFYELGLNVSEDSANFRQPRGGAKKRPEEILYPDQSRSQA